MRRLRIANAAETVAQLKACKRVINRSARAARCALRDLGDACRSLKIVEKIFLAGRLLNHMVSLARFAATAVGMCSDDAHHFKPLLFGKHTEA